MKRVGPKSKAWFDKELQSIHRLRALARWAEKHSRSDPALHARTGEFLSQVNSLLLRRTRIKRRETDNDLYRRIEASQAKPKLFFAKWKSRTRSFGDSKAPTAVLNEDGQLVTDPVSVLRTWKDFVQKLGEEEPISDVGDHAIEGRREAVQ